jgi:hypothetical protein
LGNNRGMSSRPSPRVPWPDRAAGALRAALPSLGPGLAALESRVLRAEIDAQPLERPVYICGLARAGSTLLLQFLAEAPGFASHCYADFPLLWTPYWAHWLRTRTPQQDDVPRERAHGDRIAVTRQSPEALEEPFWMHFFPGRHDPVVDQVLAAGTVNAPFTKFYRDHIRKLLLARGARRYLSKGNYNLSRIAFLKHVFPDVRIVLTQRAPLAHVASLLRQDRAFSAWSAADPAVGRQLARSGHFEFGPHKRALAFGDTAAAARIQACFDAGRNVEGYARQWAAAYGWLARTLAADEGLAAACHVVDYERLCAAPKTELAALYAFVGIEPAAAAGLVAAQAARVAAPDYYAADLSAADQDLVRNLTEGMASVPKNN